MVCAVLFYYDRICGETFRNGKKSHSRCSWDNMKSCLSLNPKQQQIKSRECMQGHLTLVASGFGVFLFPWPLPCHSLSMLFFLFNQEKKARQKELFSRSSACFSCRNLRLLSSIFWWFFRVTAKSTVFKWIYFLVWYFHHLYSPGWVSTASVCFSCCLWKGNSSLSTAALCY